MVRKPYIFEAIYKPILGHPQSRAHKLPVKTQKMKMSQVVASRGENAKNIMKMSEREECGKYHEH